MRRRTVGAVVLAVLAAAVLVGCATPAAPGAGPGLFPSGIPTPTTTIDAGPRHTEVTQPDPFVIVYDRTQLNLRASTYCFGNACVDGFDDDPPSVGSPEEIRVLLPDGFTEVGVSQIGSAGDYCTGRGVEATVTDLGDGWWSVRPGGPADDYLATVFAHGPAGDMGAQLRWATPTDHALPDPGASLTLVVDHDGKPDSYGVELMVRDLSATPSEYSATITATAADGATHSFDASTSHDCHGEGALFFDGPAAEGITAAKLGDFPFSYRVELTLDGTTYVGTGVYPDDLTVDDDLAVPLTFTPALP